MTEPAIAVADVVVEYPKRGGVVRALTVDRFEVAAGTAVAVMGPSGCGKSTLLGLLAGLAVPTRGTVRVGTTELSSAGNQARAAFRRHELGMVYQADNLLPHLTVAENVGLSLAVSGAGDDPEARCAEVLDRLDLAELAHRRPDQLSGGQRQRVGVARAVAHHPSVLLADEPTGALDPATRGAVVSLLLDAQRSVGATMVVVTHDPVVAAMVPSAHRLDAPSRAPESGHAG